MAAEMSLLLRISLLALFGGVTIILLLLSIVAALSNGGCLSTQQLFFSGVAAWLVFIGYGCMGLRKKQPK